MKLSILEKGNCMMSKKLLMSLAILLSINICASENESLSIDDAMRHCLYDDSDYEQCCNSLSIKDLCAKKIKAKQGLFRELCAQTIKAKDICTENLGVIKDVAITNLCANQFSASTLCVTGTARLNEVCGIYRASVGFAADTPYSLGTPVDFDDVYDDPNGNVTTAPFTYTVPVSGYYVASVQVDIADLMGTDPILGVPVSNLILNVNGTDRRRSFIPFLTFNPSQQSDLSFILVLEAGDVVTIRYEVLVVDVVTGLTNYTGTSLIRSGDNRTIFQIHYLSSSCNPAHCQPCSLLPVPCNNECIPLPNSCAPVCKEQK